MSGNVCGSCSIVEKCAEQQKNRKTARSIERNWVWTCVVPFPTSWLIFLRSFWEAVLFKHRKLKSRCRIAHVESSEDKLQRRYREMKRWNKCNRRGRGVTSSPLVLPLSIEGLYWETVATSCLLQRHSTSAPAAAEREFNNRWVSGGGAPGVTPENSWKPDPFWSTTSFNEPHCQSWRCCQVTLESDLNMRTVLNKNPRVTLSHYQWWLSVHIVVVPSEYFVLF